MQEEIMIVVLKLSRRQPITLWGGCSRSQIVTVIGQPTCDGALPSTADYRPNGSDICPKSSVSYHFQNCYTSNKLP